MFGSHNSVARRFKRSVCLRYVAIALSGFALLVSPSTSTAAPPLPGAIFTTDGTTLGVNLNIYDDKDDVWLNGGPAHPGAASLPDGDYYVQVTTPDGTLLGTSVGKSAGDRPAHVKSGVFTPIQLSQVLIKASGLPSEVAGYDDTTNSGGVYKVWVSTSDTFPNDSSKTDNFKVKVRSTPPPPSIIKVCKFYDANANSKFDDGETLIPDWKINITESLPDTTGLSIDRFTPYSGVFEPGNYTIFEYAPIETNWVATTEDEVNITLESGKTETVLFGNLCFGAGGGLTLGFWSNKNGQSLFEVGTDLACMKLLNLRSGDGSNFDPSDYASFRSWILKATATNMAYMLSAQLAAMKLNVLNNKVDENSIVYAPNTGLHSDLGPGNTTLTDFVAIKDLITAANTSLGTAGNTTAAGPLRTYQEALKNALDAANNNKNFVLPKPGPFSF